MQCVGDHAKRVPSGQVTVFPCTWLCLHLLVSGCVCVVHLCICASVCVCVCVWALVGLYAHVQSVSRCVCLGTKL